MNNKRDKLINRKTNEETVCTKVVVDGFDYYVNEDKIIEGIIVLYNDKIYHTVYSNTVPQGEILLSGFGYVMKSSCKKAIATNNPSIDIPQIVDEVMKFADEINQKKDYDKGRWYGRIEGYNTHAETHTLSDDEVVEFAEWKDDNHFSLYLGEWVSTLPFYSGCAYTSKELLQLFKEQKINTIYYDLE